MNILAIDTSTSACSLGLQVGDTMHLQMEQLGRSHSREILPRIDALLTQAGVSRQSLDLLVFGKGPGSFTGLRIAAGMVQGLGYGLDIPVVPVSTLACMAQGRYRRHADEHVMVAQHARMNEVFYGAFEVVEGIATLIGKEQVCDAGQVPMLPPAHWTGIGDGWHLRDSLEVAAGQKMHAIESESYPEPEDLLRLGMHEFAEGRSIPAMQARPEYLREQVAEKMKK